jgi:hypothetical protein
MKDMHQKIRGVLAVLLLLSMVRGYGQEVAVPVPIQVPAGSRLLLHLYAQGVQVYSCIPVDKDSSHYAWTFVEAKATLYTAADYGQKAGRHYFNAAHHPVWETTNGASVEGAKLQQADAPDQEAIPWLLLKAGSSSGAGPLTSTAFIQRVNTKGGKAPPVGADANHKGATLSIGYSAEYLFYANK